MAKVKLDSIRKNFAETDVLKGIDLLIEDGEFLTLVGPSGCGKSTLLRIIAGLETQSSGSVVIADDAVDKLRPSARNLAMVFQSYALYPHLSVSDNIAVPLRMRWLNFWQRLPLIRRLVPGTRQIDKKINERIGEAADSLGLEKLLHRKPGQLSGGQRQRVAVGRALVRHPDAFLLDEPLSNLDAKLRVHMRAEITQLHRKLGATFIYVTHDQAEAMTMSDRIAIMMDGELIQVGTPDEVYLDPQDIRVAEFIGSPKINIIPAQVLPTGIINLLGKEMNLMVGTNFKADELSLAVRPEHIYLITNETKADFNLRIELIENLGAEVHVHGKSLINNVSVVFRTSPELAHGLKLEGIHAVAIDLDKVLLFDAKGKRLEKTCSQLQTLASAS
jgi:multiple sugar transport system ATP-binding protein